MANDAPTAKDSRQGAQRAALVVAASGFLAVLIAAVAGAAVLADERNKDGSWGDAMGEAVPAAVITLFLVFVVALALVLIAALLWRFLKWALT